ncbi:MAG TPA: DNA mismatch repair endonuclease MutL [bacterium]
MGDIHILPENVVNQIAAGEVVERASSVLKELVENALDAGAQRIQIFIKGHGRDLVQVIDDGVGMARTDLHLAFERHATSKLHSPEDIFNIHTLGFRGEALPSMASVSFVEVRTRRDGEPSGTMMRLEGGTIVHEEPVAAPHGTSISIHSLFFNTPARAKFMKSAATELAHLVRTFKHYALAYPEVAWSFNNDGHLEYTLPSSSLIVRLEDLFGSGFAAKVLPLDFEGGGMRVTGVVGLPELNKKSRGDQFTFLNRRPIQSPMIHSAIKAALREQLEDGEWPFYALFLDVPAPDVDVNVHPAKTEVKFADERLIHGTVYRAVRMALPSVLTQEPMGDRPGDPVDYTRMGMAPRAGTTEMSFSSDSYRTAPPFASPSEAARTPEISEGADRKEMADSLFRPAIYQVHDKYLISQIRSGVAIIDQHAAHERILYERALRSFQERMFNSQQLLFPLLLELEPEEDALFSEVREDLGDLGFQIRDFGVRTYSVEAVPAGLKRASEVSMIHSMLEEYAEFRRANFAPRDALAAGFACRSAVRAGDSLSTEEMTSLVDELFACKFPLTCPHGRPTVIHIKLTELDRRFKRTE